MKLLFKGGILSFILRPRATRMSSEICSEALT